MRSKLLILILCMGVNSLIPAQGLSDSSKFSNNLKLSPLRLSIIAGVSAGAFIYQYGIKNHFLYSGERTSFHTNTRKDVDFLFYTDKFRHLYISNLLSTVYSDLFRWAGMREEQSLIYGGLVTFTYLTFVEIRDGFSRDSYFSYGDIAANLVGSAYPYLQEKIPILRSFKFKISYPSGGIQYLDRSNLEANGWEITNNWLSIDVYSLLPETAQEYYPSFINLAIGANTNIYGPYDEGIQELYIGLDWNLERLPGDGWFWNLLKKYLNFYHLPAPAVRIHPTSVWYGLKF